MPDYVTAQELAPLRFTPDMEVLEDSEATTEAGLITTLGQIGDTTFAHSGHGSRSVHAKGHGLLRGELAVMEHLPERLAQGLFAHPGRYPIAMRLSTLPGDVLDDKVSTPRGMAVKVMGVAGPRLPGSEGQTTQDFVMVNGPAFGAHNPAEFLSSLKLLASTTDKAPGVKAFISTVARGAETVIEAFGGSSGTVIAMGGQKETNILGETFYSQVPILYGDYIAKYSIAPVGDLAALTGTLIDAATDGDALRDAVAAYFAKQGGMWELRIQLCTDLETMPIEDAAVVWSEADSPYVAVATLLVGPQDSWSPANVESIDDGMAFGPWHGLAAHRPLGAVMRARKATYVSSAEQRGAHNHVPIVEPKVAALD